MGMNASKATLAIICVLFSIALLRGSAVTPTQATINAGEPQTRTVFVLADGVPPILNSPSDFTYEQGATGNTINWAYSSDSPYQYRVDGNGTTIGWTSWSVNGSHPFAVDGLASGIYNHTITVTNTYGNESIDSVFVTVLAGAPPTWDQTPVSQTLEYGYAFRYDLNASDFSGISGWWINNSVRFQIDTSGIITNKTALPVGVYNLRVNVSDNAGHTLSDTFSVTVQDTTAPTWTAPTNKSVELGQQFRYDLNATDLSSISWWVNDTTHFTIDIATGVITNKTLTVGVYGLRVNVTDLYGNRQSGTFSVTVQDTTPPTWVQTPVNQSVKLGVAFRYDLNATDPSGVSWSINDTLRFSIDGSGIIRNATNLGVGMYGLRANATDSYGNVRSATFSVVVGDTDPPTWVQTPVNQTVERGDAFRYDLNATDPSGVFWSMNDTLRFSIDGNGIIRNATNLGVGAYGLRVNATDGLGNIQSATFKVTVQDTKVPIWTPAPVDQTDELGSLFRYDVNATDFSPISWWVNDTTHFTVNGATGVITNNTFLTVGVYGLRVNVTDLYGNRQSGTFRVTVQDTTPPNWNPAPTNKIVELGESFRYDLNATDFSSIVWSVNDAAFQIDANGVLTNATFLTPGVYQLQVNATDAYYNVLTGFFTVTVGDTMPPEWIEIPADQIAELGSPFRYDLNATDPSGVTYTYINNTAFEIDIVTGVITNKAFLAVGVYALQVIVMDGEGYTLFGSFSVTVQDTTPPTWGAPTNQSVELGTSFRYDLNASDFSSILWWVNDTVNFAIDSATGVLTNKTTLTLGVYGLRVNVTDIYSNRQTGTFTITVQDTLGPAWAETPVDHVIEAGTGFRYDLNASDLSGISQYWLNDTAHFTIDGIGVVTNATALSAGVYPLHVYANDTEGNILSGIFTVTVLSSAPPTWDQTPSDKVVELGLSFRYDLNASDYSGIGTWYVNNTVHFAIDGLGIITNTTSLTVGVYNLRVNVTDILGNIQTATFKLTVRDTTQPSWVQRPSDLQFEENTTGHALSWTAYDLAPGTIQILRNGTPAGNPAWTTRSQVITISVDGLTAGAYNYTIVVTDGSGNAIVDSAWVTVTKPTTTPAGGITDIITTILNLLMNGYVVTGIILAVAALAVVRGRRKPKTYEPRDVTTKFK
jgi:hypothetical protein